MPGGTDSRFTSGAASLYIHIPFCFSKCSYCDFYSAPIGGRGDERQRLFEAFLTALLEDIGGKLRLFAPSATPTVYIGGGTPSLLPAELLQRLFAFLAASLPGREDVREFTVEANPESIDAAFLDACRSGGVTRLSVGVQTFDDSAREAVRRPLDAQAVRAKLRLLASSWPGELSFDLISGLPHQSPSSLLADIETLAGTACTHISLYDLTPGAGTEEAAAMWITGRDALEERGFAQYEVSNFARGGARSLHNTRYWRMESWLAAGPAASATLVDETSGTGFRYTVPPDLDAYLDPASRRRGRLPESETLDRLTLCREMLLMGFRTLDGPAPQLFARRFGRPLEDVIPATLTKWRKRGLSRTDRAALTREGLLFLNAFLRDCFEEAAV